jgi:hypothetical protein
MSHKIIIKDPEAFRAALQQNDKLFDSIKELVERCDADHPLAFETTKLPFVFTTRES